MFDRYADEAFALDTPVVSVRTALRNQQPCHESSTPPITGNMLGSWLRRRERMGADMGGA